MDNRIKSVISINQLGSKGFKVGVNGIVEIKDNSLEYEDSVHIQFDAYDKEGKLKGTFINGAFAIDYF